MKKILFFSIVFCIICFATGAEAAITSTTLTPASPTTLSNGKAYYCAGTQYTFRIQSTDPAATGVGYWSTAVVQFRDNGTVQENFTINISDLSSPSATVQNGVAVVSITPVSMSYTNIDIQVTIRFLWGSAYFDADGTNNDVRLTVTNSSGSGTDTRLFYYGVISRIQVLSFKQDGDAADGRVNPWHDGFNVTGRIAYYSAGETISTLVPAAEISGLTLYRQGGTVPAGPTVVFSGANNNFQYAVPAVYFSFGALTAATATTGAYTWSISAVMASSGETETAIGTLGIDVGMVSVSAGGFTFVNGGGVNSPPQLYYVRSVNVSGTEIRLATTAAMVGTVTFRIQDSLSNNYTLQVANGASSGTVLLGATPTAAQVTAGNNTGVTYTVLSVTGGAYGNVNPLSTNGQNSSALILNSTGYACRWENAHWPGYGSTPFTAEVGTALATATSFTIRWTALSAANAAPYDADFYTYRVYYKRNVDTAWQMLDRSNAPALGTIGAGTVTYTVGGAANALEPLTVYNYRVSAVDVFGNEVPLANQISQNVSTSALTVEASITDGISTYGNDSFGVPLVDPPPTNPVTHGVRKTAIKVTVYMVTAGTAPEKVNIIIANNNSDLPGQFGLPTGANNDILTLAEGVDRWTIPCSKITANTYQAIIPSGHPLMAMNTNIRFIISAVVSGATSYYDHTPDASPPGDWWSDEWRFRVSKKALFIPYPTRVLNNVLTAQLPCCYPAFFLSVDSLVTIKVFDAKGRIIATLCENLYRPGGQNIKDLGWCGYTKDYRRVGPGLYYIHIKAVTLGDKTVLDKKLKVVVAH